MAQIKAKSFETPEDNILFSISEASGIQDRRNPEYENVFTITESGIVQLLKPLDYDKRDRNQRFDYIGRKEIVPSALALFLFFYIYCSVWSGRKNGKSEQRLFDNRRRGCQ